MAEPTADDLCTLLNQAEIYWPDPVILHLTDKDYERFVGHPPRPETKGQEVAPGWFEYKIRMDNG